MKIVYLLFLIFPFSFSQTTNKNRIDTILDLLIKNSTEISDYIFPAELLISNRFGIKYEGNENKFLIANEIPKELSGDLLDGKIKYEVDIKNLKDNFSLLSFTIPALNIKREYFFKDSLLVSSTCYYSRNWKVITSDHFKFVISNESLFNDYTINLLENFIIKISDILLLTDKERNLLKENKIFYFLCKDEAEMQKVTGYETRGIYVLAQDFIITTYNTHYHELLHFLINFKLRKLPLYTHPFLQEGFAVAYGGRGGLEAHTISEMGIFMTKSGFANYNELLNKSDFQKSDASISYPISGLYSNFLIKQIGIDNYLELYKLYSGSSEKVFTEKINEKYLLPDNQWNKFIDSLSTLNPVKIKDKLNISEYTLLKKQNNFEVYENEAEYFFRVKDTLLVNESTKIKNYQSNIFKQNFPNRKYDSEKYLIIANSNEISVYNLFSNNLIGKYVVSFSVPPNTVPLKDGLYEFTISKDLFDEHISETNVTF